MSELVEGKVEETTVDYATMDRKEFYMALQDCATVDMARTVLKQLSSYNGEVPDEIQIRRSMAGHLFNMLQFKEIKRI